MSIFVLMSSDQMKKQRRGTEASRSAAPPVDTKTAPRQRSRLIIAVAAIVIAASVSGFLFFRRSAAAPGVRTPDIILITIDTLRADSVGFMGNKLVSTPFLDALAAKSTVFTDAHAHNVVTLPSHANILTGLYPYQHGIRDNAGYTLDAKYATAAGHLRKLRYATGAFVGAYPLDARYGLGHDFDVYDDKYREGSTPLSFAVDDRSASEVLAAAGAWFGSISSGPRFLWAHLYDPHAPYTPPPPFADQFRDNPYLGEISYVDAELRRFLEPILAAKPETVVIVTSDHGEALGDHGELTHGLFAYEATLKVPLLVYDGGRSGGRDGRSARHIDVLPTILARVGIEKPAALPGASLLAKPVEGDSYFEALTSSLNRGWAPLVGLIHERQKYIDLPIPELYDLPHDPAEQRNLFATERRTVAKLRKLLADGATANATSARSVSTEEQAQLLSLGYISGTTASRKNYTEEDDPKRLVDVDSKLHRIVDLYQRRDLKTAAEVGRQVIRDRPGMSVAYDMLAFVLHESEKPQEAIAVLREGFARGVSSDQMKKRMGLILSESGGENAKQAAALLEAFAGERDPDMLNAYGIALADSGRIQEALEQFRKVLEIDKTNAKAYQNHGIVALRAGRVPEAREALARALELNDQLPLALNASGVIYAREGKFDKAVESWHRAATLDPQQYDALFNLGLVAPRTGRWDLADAALEQFIRSAPPERYGADLRKAEMLRAEIARRRADGATAARP